MQLSSTTRYSAFYIAPYHFRFFFFFSVPAVLSPFGAVTRFNVGHG